MKPTTTSTLFLGNFVRVSKDLYAPALGGIMLSIGIKLSIDDFGLALKRPVPLSVGYFAQYAIKPALGIVLAKIGNPLFKLDRGALATYEFFWSHGMIFDEVGLRIKNDCEFDRLVDASLIPIRERAKLKGELVPELGSACLPHSGTLGTIAYAYVQISAAGTFLGCFLTGLSFLLKDHSLLLGLVPIMAVSGVLIFISRFSIGMGAVLWLIMSEILPLNIKGVAGSLVVLVNWIGAWLVSYTFNFLVSWSSAVGGTEKWGDFQWPFSHL